MLIVGPSWAVWPTPTDFASMLLVGAAFLLPAPPPGPLVGYRKALAALFTFCAVSYICMVIVPPLLQPPPFGGGSKAFGAFHVLRLVEFFFVFAAAQRVPLNAARLATLRWVAFAVLGWLVLSVVLTYLVIIPAGDFAPQLPDSLDLSGPWWFYVHSLEGVGTVGYNHAYTALQITLMTGLALQLAPKAEGWPSILLLLATLVAVFMSGSRAGLATHLLFACGYLVRSPAKLIAAGCAGAVLFLAVASSTATSRSTDQLLGRQTTLLNPFDSDNLSGRGHIWQDRIDWLNENPIYWAFGAGLGGTADSGGPAHMLPLQIVAELGLVGLAFVAILLTRFMADLLAERRRLHALFWCTVALLVSGMSQETFYPEPAFGHFLGLYLFAIAVSVGPSAAAQTSIVRFARKGSPRCLDTPLRLTAPEPPTEASAP